MTTSNRCNRPLCGALMPEGHSCGYSEVAIVFADLVVLIR